MLYDSPANVPNTIDISTTAMMPGVIGALKTGDKAWLTIFNRPDYTGDQLRIGPNTTYNDLNKVKRGDSGDWKNQIESFQITDKPPVEWTLSFNLSTFHSFFPNNFDDGTIPSGSTSGPAIGYYTQDAQYRIYDPGISYPTTDTMLITVPIDHVVDMGGDDHVILDITIQSDGTLQSVGYSWDAGGAYQIPDEVVNAVDDVAKLAGDLELWETLGVSEVEAQAFIQVFDTACTVFNDISKLVNNWAETDGGRFYLIAVAGHVINRVCVSVTVS